MGQSGVKNVGKVKFLSVRVPGSELMVAERTADALSATYGVTSGPAQVDHSQLRSSASHSKAVRLSGV